MNRQRSIVMFAAIAAVAMTAIGLTGVSATQLMVAPQSPEGMGMLGHVEYTLMGSDNMIKGYFQADNIVVEDGKDCVANELFGITPAGGTCGTAGTMQYIAISNFTGGTAAVGDQELFHEGATDLCASTAVAGEMARLLTVPAIDTGASGTTGTIVTLEVPKPFQFFDITNTTGATGTTIFQSGIFNNQEAGTPDATTGECTDWGEADVDWNMFAIQDLNGGSGIKVTDGDSLSIKWTITIGSTA